MGFRAFGGRGDADMRRLLDSLDLAGGLDLDRLRRLVEARRGTTIRLIGLTGVAGLPCGMWLSRDDGIDLVFYDMGATEVHRQHIVLHEFAHMLLGHGGADVRPGAGGLISQVAPDTVVRMLARAGYLSEQEQAAERLASAIALKGRRAAAAQRVVADARIARLERTIGDRATPG